MSATIIALRKTPSRPAPGVYAAIGLRGDPFPPDGDNGAYVPLRDQETILAAVRDWLGQAGDASGLAVVAGPTGSGKTRLLDRLVQAIADDDRLIGVVPAGTPRTDADLPRLAIRALGGRPEGRTGLDLTTELRSLLDAQRADLLAPVLLIDDAGLTGSQLEILRGVLAGPGPGEPTRTQIVLFGPPALPDRIARRRSLAGQARRIETIPPLTERDARTLLAGRVAAMHDPDRVAPATPFFSPGAVAILLEAAAANPGRLLELAHAATREAIATGRPHVDEETAQTVVMPNADGRSLAQGIASADPVIQTRLLLPEVVHAAEVTRSDARRRGRQR